MPISCSGSSFNKCKEVIRKRQLPGRLWGGPDIKEIRNPLRQLKRNTFILSRYLRQEGCKTWLNGCTVFPNRNAWWAKGRPEKCLDSKEELLRYLTTPKRQPLNEVAVRRSVEILKKCVQERPVLTRAEFNNRLARSA